MTSTSLANPAAWANAFAVSMITDVGLMSSILPTDGTNYAAPQERVWGQLDTANKSGYDDATMSTLWTGKSGQSLPPQKRYLPKLSSDLALSGINEQVLAKQNANLFETSTDLSISKGEDQSTISEHQYGAAQAYYVWLSSVLKSDDDPLGKKTALERGYLLAMNGVMISLFSSGSFLGLFVDLASKFAELSRMQHMKNGRYREAAGDMARFLWLQAHYSDASQTSLFYPFAQAQSDNIIHLLERNMEPAANLAVIDRFAKSARDAWMQKNHVG